MTCIFCKKIGLKRSFLPEIGEWTFYYPLYGVATTYSTNEDPSINKLSRAINYNCVVPSFWPKADRGLTLVAKSASFMCSSTLLLVWWLKNKYFRLQTSCYKNSENHRKLLVCPIWSYFVFWRVQGVLLKLELHFCSKLLVLVPWTRLECWGSWVLSFDITLLQKYPSSGSVKCW